MELAMTTTTHDIGFQNAGAGTLAAGIATFGEVFKRGEVPSGTSLTASNGTTSLAVQMDVKTRWDDGSVKMAVLAVERPALAPGSSLDLVLKAGGSGPQGAALDMANALAGHSFVADVKVSGGAQTSVDVLAALKTALADGSASVWQSGPLASETRVEVELPGSQRMVFDVTVFKGGGFAVDAQFNNDGAMESVGGRVTYDLKVTMDGKVATQATLNQSQYQNWHESYASNAKDGGQGIGTQSAGWLNIKHDIAHLQDTGAVADYNLGLTIDQSILNGYAKAIAASGWDAPLAAQGLEKYMPNTGGRSDIGFTTEANAVWLITQDPIAAAFAMGQAEAASTIPWHFWDAANDTWLNTDAYPNLWLDPRGGTGKPGDASSTGLTQQIDNKSGWTADTAHQPDLSYVPYILTGERWMLDNLQAQSTFSILANWPDPRGGDADNVINNNQVRGAAWSLRQIDEAALVSPDGSKEKAYFQASSDANYKWLVSKIPEWTAQQGEAHGWVPGDYGTSGAMPPWQQDYFASTVIAAARNGNEDAKTFLEWQSNFLVGRFLSEDQGFEMRDGAAYWVAISDASTGRVYTTWDEIGAQTVARGWSNGDTSWKQSGGDYPQLALATLAGIYEVTGKPAAKAAYEALIKEAPPFTSASDFAKDPNYAIAAPGTTTSQPETPVSGPPVVVVPPVVVPPVVVPPVVVPPVVVPPVVVPPVVVPPVVEPPVVVPPVVVPPTTPAPGMESLAVVLGAESWNGNPIAVIKVDGTEVFRGEIAAQISAGGQVVQLGQFAANVAHKIEVQFTNDAWGGTASTDRNLHVESVLVDGVATGQKQALLNSGTATFNLAAKAVPIPDPTPEPTPAPVPVLEVPVVTDPDADVLTIGISQDAWKGDARYHITIDGVKYGDERAATASHAAGKVEYITVTGDFSASKHTLGVTFLNDGWGGTASTDRNLYVTSVALNDVDLNKSAALLNNGTVKFDFKGITTSEPMTTIGTGPDVLHVSVSQDAYKGDAQFLLFIDGKQQGAVHTAYAAHAQGQSDIIALHGNFTEGDHVLDVRFINDAWGGTATTDRNLYVDGLQFNGADLNQHAALTYNTDVFLHF